MLAGLNLRKGRVAPVAEYSFYTLDVFTDRVFGGNPLAVFPEARGLTDRQMQQVARELNLSETVFLFVAESGGTRRARIFTPAAELPFAGHPTIGTACLLAEMGEGEQSGGGGEAAIGAAGAALLGGGQAVVTGGSGGVAEAGGERRVRIVLEENVGPVPVEVWLAEGRPARARFRAAGKLETRPCGMSREEVARLIGLEAGEIGWPEEGRIEPAFASAGVPFLVVPVRGLEAIRKARIEMGAFERFVKEAWGHEVYLISRETEAADADLHVRMFAPALGVPEDPATGAAAAAVAVYLGERLTAPAGDASGRWAIEQGIEMGRPSRIVSEAEMDGGRVAAVYVSGEAVRVSEGRMTVPEAGE